MPRAFYPLLFALSYVGTRFRGVEVTARCFKALGAGLLKLGARPRLSPDQINADLGKSYHSLPLAVRCLDQAIVTWFLLNLNRHKAELKIGFTLSPFMSHAWVEAGDEKFVDFIYREDMHEVARFAPWS